MTISFPDTASITRILPHRPPFLLVDRIDALGDTHIDARLFLDPQMFFFAGHFPHEPIMPGVLVVEALAQAAGLLLGLRRFDSSPPAAFFLARTEIKFPGTAVPGENLVLHATLTRHFGGLFRFDVAARVDARRIAEGNLALAQRPDRGSP